MLVAFLKFKAPECAKMEISRILSKRQKVHDLIFSYNTFDKLWVSSVLT